MVLLTTAGGGPLIFQADCDPHEVSVEWLDAKTLRISYLDDARVVQKHSKSNVVGHEIAVVYAAAKRGQT